jgi:hypothetical protein
VQDFEYEEAVEAALIKEEEQASALRIATEEQNRTAMEAQRKETELTAFLQQMPPEPPKGVTIAVAMPEGGKPMRRFDPAAEAHWVYVWVAGATLSTAHPLSLGSFELSTTVGSVKLEEQQTLSQQGITGRVLLVVSVL